MAITMGAEVSLFLQFDSNVSYADVEEALTAEGFTNYTVSRNNVGSATDVQLTVRAAPDQNGQTQPLDAVATIGSLADVVEALAA